MTAMLALVLVALLVGCSKPEPPPPPAAVVVDLDLVAKELGQDKTIQGQVQEANERLSKELVEMANYLVQRLQQQQAYLAEHPNEQAEKLLEDRLNEANFELASAQRTAEQRSTEYSTFLVQQFREDAKNVAREVASRLGVKIVLTASATLLWYEGVLDITNQVVAEMRLRRGDITDDVPR